MDFLLISIAVMLLVLGLLGCFLPILPGPPLSFAGLLLASFTRWASIGWELLLVLGAVTILVTVIDYILPIWTTKKYGGSKRGVWGATIGVVAGMFLFPPIGIIIGPLVGAYLGELTSSEHRDKALRSAMGSFIGFILGVGLKLANVGVITYYFIRGVV